MIENLYIENFKCFTKKEINLNNLTVLSGINSSGKTSVIQSLLLIKQSIQKYNQNYSLFNESIFINMISYQDEEISKKIINTFEAKIQINDVDNLNLENTKEILNSYSSNNTIFFKVKSNDNIVKLIYEVKNEDNQHLYLTNIFTEDYVLEKIFNTSNFYYVSSNRFGPKNRNEITHLDYPYTGNYGEHTSQLIYEKSSSNIEKDKKFPHSDSTLFKTQLELWLNYIIEGSKYQVTTPQSLVHRIVSTKFKDSYLSSVESSSSNVGFGISYVLPIIVNGLLAPNNSIYIIENPEIHLHPSAQSRLGIFLSVIANSGVQVIIETHSEHLINGISLAIVKDYIDNKKASISFFSKILDNEKVEILIQDINFNEYGEISGWPKGFFDQQELDMIELIKEKKKKKSVNDGK